MSNKKIKEYNDKYSNIPNDFQERFLYLIHKLNIKPYEINKLKKQINRNLKLQYKTISFVFYFTPQATPRPRYSRFTGSFYVKNALDYNGIFGEFINENKLKHIIDTPCEFICKTFHPIPNTMNKIETIMAELGLVHVTSKPDFDNLAKTYSDMIQKHLIYDDSLIYKANIEKRYSIKPRIELTIRYLEDYDSKFNARKVKK